MGHNKILLTIILGIFMISLVSAFEFDNKLTYSKNDMKVDFDNLFGYGKHFGEIELKSHSSITEIKDFIWGEEKVVMYYDFTNWTFQKDGLGEVIFTNMTSGKEIKKDYYFVIWKEVDVVVNEYEDVFSHIAEYDGEAKYNRIKVGEHIEKKFRWVRYDSKDILKGNSRIGLKTYVGKDDYIDGVWTVVGKKVKKHITWAADIDSSLVVYYEMEGINGTDVIEDSFGSYDGTSVNITYNSTSGKIGGGAIFDRSTSRMNVSAIDINYSASDWTISGWLKADEATLHAGLFTNTLTSDTNSFRLGIVSGTIYLQNGANAWYGPGPTVDDSVWRMWTATYDVETTNFSFYLDAVCINTTSDYASWGGSRTAPDIQFLGIWSTLTQNLRGVIDESFIANETYNQEIIDYLYNDGEGVLYGGDEPDAPVVTLETPNNFTNFTATNEVDFECLPYDYVNDIVNVSLYIDDVLNETNTDGLNDTSAWFNKILSEGNHTWTCEVYSNISLSFTASAFTLNIDTTPNIQFEDPTYANDTSIISSYIPVGVSLTETFFENITFTFDLDGTQTEYFYENDTREINKSFADGEWWYNVTTWTTTGRSNTTETRNITIDTTPNIVYGDGVPTDHTNQTTNSFEVNVSLTETFFKNVTFDLYNANGVLNQTETFTDAIREKVWSDLPDATYSYNVTTATTTNQFNNTATRNISIDINAPSVSVFSPPTNIEFHEINTNLSLNWSANDTNLDTCIYNYNTTNITATCSDNQTGMNITDNSYTNVSFWVNDSFGNVNYTFIEWNYILFENSREFSATTIQTASETFRFLGSKDSGILSTAGVLWYNETSYTSITTTSGNEFNLTSSINIPITTLGNISFFWEITFINATGSFSFNTTNSTQVVGVLEMQECYAPAIDGLTLNFTTYDSTNLTTLNTTLEATFQFYMIGGTGGTTTEYLFSDLNENRSNYMYCLNSSGENVTLNAFISYGATNYDSREYIINDGIIGNFTQNIPLYLTETDLTDIITITVQDQSYDPIAGVLVAVQKWNIGTNTYSTIGMLTTSSVGQGIMDLELYNTWYRAVVSINGEIVETTDVQKLSSTSWIITIQRGEDNPYDLFGSVSHGLTFGNTTNITSFTWLDSSGYTSRGCLVVINATTLGPTTIQNSCTESVSGTIDYYISGNGDYTIYGIIYLTGYNQSQIVDVLEIRLGTPLITTTVSPFGKVISFIMVGTAGLIGVSAGSAILGIFLIIAMLIVCLYFGFLNITWGFIWGIISIGILILFLQRRKR